MPSEPKRKLAAIMFTDMVGYTALMQKDEPRARELIENQRGLLTPLVKKHDGEVLQYVGDGTFCTFNSAIEAVNCAIEIQLALLTEEGINLRIGIHVGDVVVKGDEIYGDGVNVASRLEPLAEPGGICISGRVYEDVRNKPDMETIFLGEKSLKNVEGSMKVYAMKGEGLPTPQIDTSITEDIKPRSRVKSQRNNLIGGTVVVLVLMFAMWTWLGQSADTMPVKFIAVLPFDNYSGNAEDEYFSDGITEDIIAHLTNIGDLMVISRSSVMPYKGTNRNIREIAQTLGVGTILEGSVRRSAGKVRIVAQLIDTHTDKHLWAETYDRDVDETDIFSLQSDVAQKIATALKVTLTPNEKTLIETPPTENLTAYDDYLKARFFWNRRTREDTWKAVKYFNEAIKKDSTYALAYSGLADCYAVNAGQLLGISISEAEDKARSYALKALELDSSLVEPLTVLAQLRWLHEWDLEGSDSLFQKAIEINPHYVTTLRRYAYALIYMGRYEEAVERIDQARRLDPLSLVSNIDRCAILQFTRNYDDAIEQCRETLIMDPDHRFVRRRLADAYRHNGLIDEAVAEYEKLGATWYIHLTKGDIKEARRLLDQSVALEEPQRYNFPSVGLKYAALGDFDEAFKYLDKAYISKSPWLISIKAWPELDPMHSDPRFEALVKKLGFK